ncbi:hypothetical protein M758_3G113700 [Ceratodon purpureus]|nr:hypothetical protein M758_3G113700 [Ceratodon purpureus]
MQGEEAYYRAVVAKHRYVTMASLQRMSQTRQSKITKARMSSQIHTKAKASATPGELQRYSTLSESRSSGSGYEVLNKRTLRAPPDSAKTEPGKMALKKFKEEKPRAKSSIARFGSLSRPDHPLELLATEKELKNKEKDIELLQKNIQRLSVQAQKPDEPSSSTATS